MADDNKAPQSGIPHSAIARSSAMAKSKPPTKRVAHKSVAFAVEKGPDSEASIKTRNRSRRAFTKEFTFTGSAKKLVAFIMDRRDHPTNPLSAARCRDLVAAVQNLSSGAKFAVNNKRGNASDAQQSSESAAVTGLLKSFGVAYNDSKQDEIEEDFGANRNTKFTQDLSAMLATPHFDAKQFVAQAQAAKDNRDIRMLKHMYEMPQNMISSFTLDKRSLSNFLESIKSEYLDNTYHNWGHALEVAQCCHWATTVMTGRYVSFQDIVALFTAAIGHDVGHPGGTNPFLVRTEHELALIYNDKSPLENMHSHLLFQTLYKPGNNFCAKATRFSVRDFREKVVHAILATDVSGHFTFVDKLNLRLGQLETDPIMEDGMSDGSREASKEDRRMILDAFLHTADLAHNFKPFDIHKWGLKGLEEEWFCQGDRERELGIAISPNCDRRKDSAVGCQSFFLGSFVRPLVHPLSVFFPEEYTDTVLVNLDFNKQHWEDAVREHGLKKVADLVNVVTADYLGEARSEDESPSISDSDDQESDKSED